tara:strand:+ start:45092 stop:45574 length:483 start_codon:yes stop_codon:yes gene_type:complete
MSEAKSDTGRNSQIPSLVMEGSVHLDYNWNPGAVIGAFLTALRSGELRAGKCNKTGKHFLPAQSRSPFGGRCDTLVEVQDSPVLKVGTIVHRAPWNLPEGVQPPYMLASISYPGVETDLIHLVVGPLETLKELQEGSPLLAVFADERKGSIRDILYFQKK